MTIPPRLRRPAAQRLAVIGFGLVAIGTLAGCTATPAATPADDPSPDSGSAASSPAAEASTPAAAPDASSGIYRDGTYTADGPYVSPGGNVSVGVSLTLKDDAITAVTVTPKASDPTSKQYETQFASGISAAVVGKQLEGLSVGAVSGSSLTGKGFETALKAIRKDAAA